MDRPKQWQEGYQDFMYGVSINENPYDRGRQPEQYKAWRAGWKFAKYMRENQ